MTVRLEVCVESLADALAAARVGALRVEVCGALSLGGVTPSAGLVELVVERARPACVALVRPRPGDFVYDAHELAQMRRDVERFRALGAGGVALGALTPEGRLDRAALADLIAAARPLDVCLHRAFDRTADLDRALDEAVELGFDRILTSGGCASAPDGADVLARLVERAAGRLAILPGGGVRAANVAALVQRTGASEVHTSAGRWFAGASTAEALALGAADLADGRVWRVDPDELTALAGALAAL